MLQGKDYKIRILDLAGGTQSRAISDIADIFTADESLREYNVTSFFNVDYSISKQACRPRVYGIRGEALYLPFPNNCIDLIYSHMYLDYLAAYEQSSVLSEIARVLKPGGIAVLWGFDQLPFSAADTDARINYYIREPSLILGKKPLANRVIDALQAMKYTRVSQNH